MTTEERRGRVYIPEFVCGLIVGAIGIFVFMIGFAVYAGKKKNQQNPCQSIRKGRDFYLEIYLFVWLYIL